jgi:nitroreductase
MKKMKAVYSLALCLSLLNAGPPVLAEGTPTADLAAVDHILTTTRTVRKRLALARPVDPKTIEQAIDIALQAPTGSNRQGWQFIVVTDPGKKKIIADLYRKSADVYAKNPRPNYTPDDPRAKQGKRITDSATYLYQHLHEVPAIVFAAIEGRVEKEPAFVQASTYGSILPSAWSFMLALRARGVGSAWTTLALKHEKEIAQALGIPDNITLAVMLPVAYYTGTDFKPATRLPARDHTHWNAWGQRR